jgi:hypothetical protein
LWLSRHGRSGLLGLLLRLLIGNGLLVRIGQFSGVLRITGFMCLS